jgi:hypothetical protein
MSIFNALRSVRDISSAISILDHLRSIDRINVASRPSVRRSSRVMTAAILAGGMLTAACGMDATTGEDVGTSKSAMRNDFDGLVTLGCINRGGTWAIPGAQVELASTAVRFESSMLRNGPSASDVQSYGALTMQLAGFSGTVPEFEQESIRRGFVTVGAGGVPLSGIPATTRDGYWGFGPTPGQPVWGSIRWSLPVVRGDGTADVLEGDARCGGFIPMVSPPQPQGCSQPSDCAGLPGTPVCDVSTGKCVAECTTVADCASKPGRPVCDTSVGLCVAECTKLADCAGKPGTVCDVAAGTCVPAPRKTCASGPPNGFICDDALNPLGPTPFSDLNQWNIDRNRLPNTYTPTSGGSGLSIQVSSAVGYTQLVTKSPIIAASVASGTLYQVAFRLREDLSPLVPGAAARAVGDVYVSATTDLFSNNNSGGGTFRPNETDQVYTFIAEANGTDQFLKIAIDCETIWGCQQRNVDISSVIANPIDPSDIAAYNTINSDFQYGLTPWVGADQDRGGATQSASAGAATLFRAVENFNGGKSRIMKPILPVPAGTTYTVSFDYSSPTAGAVAVPQVSLETAKATTPASAGIQVAALPLPATATPQRFSRTFTVNPAQDGRLLNLIIDNSGNGVNQTLVIGPVSITKP